MTCGMLVLASGTYAFRFAGPALRSRIAVRPGAGRVLEAAAVVLLAALAATTALMTGHEFAGFARPAGVLVAGILAWRKVPFILVVLAAAGTAAVLRVSGVR
jgi:branched-subunit amino acid transport protein